MQNFQNIVPPLIWFYKNEIIAITGLLGSGKTAIASAIFGLNPLLKETCFYTASLIILKVLPMPYQKVFLLCPKDRLLNAVVSDFDITNNMVLLFLDRHSWFSFLKPKNLERKATVSISELG